MHRKKIAISAFHQIVSIVLVGFLVLWKSPTQAQTPSWMLLFANRGPLMTYDNKIIRKDGYKISPQKPGEPNFMECDATLRTVDEKLLVKASAADCGNSAAPGMLEAYVNDINSNGDVHLITPKGNQIIAKSKWDELNQSYAVVFNPNNKVKVGDFAALLKDEHGHYNTMYKLAPTPPRGGS